MIISRDTHVSKRHMLLGREGNEITLVIQFSYETLHQGVAAIIPIQTRGDVELLDIPANFFPNLVTKLTPSDEGDVFLKPSSAPLLSDSPTIQVVDKAVRLGMDAHDVFINHYTMQDLLDKFEDGWKFVVVRLPKGKHTVQPFALRYSGTTRMPAFQATSNGFPLYSHYDGLYAWVSAGKIPRISQQVVGNKVQAIDINGLYTLGQGTIEGEDVASLAPEALQSIFTLNDVVHASYVEGMIPNAQFIVNAGKNAFADDGWDDIPEDEDDDYDCGDPACGACYPKEAEAVEAVLKEVLSEPVNEWGDEENTKTEPAGEVKKFTWPEIAYQSPFIVSTTKKTTPF